MDENEFALKKLIGKKRDALKLHFVAPYRFDNRQHSLFAFENSDGISSGVSMGDANFVYLLTANLSVEGPDKDSFNRMLKEKKVDGYFLNRKEFLHVFERQLALSEEKIDSSSGLERVLLMQNRNWVLELKDDFNRYHTSSYAKLIKKNLEESLMQSTRYFLCSRFGKDENVVVQTPSYLTAEKFKAACYHGFFGFEQNLDGVGVTPIQAGVMHKVDDVATYNIENL